ncbi:hypothetical protein [Nonlabens ponticola]|uniref:Uncharacterized protein n=1 Tax=Nonlabens ponticola TaxID=2496866 RepID=A0A3S9MU96_9FLAO|nr:hypothetical protein [Nonlabens ponticola]AZQ42741.1 hypothetical protein EJ995_00235 [Nonlabens ponticola]
MNFLLYFDPGLGAMIAQAAIAAFAGFVLFYKTVIATVKHWLGMDKTDTADSFDDAYQQEEKEQ